jgi:hypothetical protein
VVRDLDRLAPPDTLDRLRESVAQLPDSHPCSHNVHTLAVSLDGEAVLMDARSRAEVTMELEPAGREHWTACPFAAAGTL